MRFFGYAAGSVFYRGQLYLTLRRVYLLEYSNECEVVVTRAERRLWSSELHRSCGCLHFGGIAEFCNVGSTKLSSALVNHSWFAKLRTTVMWITMKYRHDMYTANGMENVSSIASERQKVAQVSSLASERQKVAQATSLASKRQKVAQATSLTSK